MLTDGYRLNMLLISRRTSKRWWLLSVLTRSCLTTSKVFKRRAVFAGEGVGATDGLAGGVDVWRDDLVEQQGELRIRQGDAVERLEVLAEVGLERDAVADVGAVLVLQLSKLVDPVPFELALS